jgi:hypothetical protein
MNMPDSEKYGYSSEEERRKSQKLLDNLKAGKLNFVSSSGISRLGTSNSVDRPEPDCAYENTQCTMLKVELPYSQTGQSPQIVTISYFCSNRGSSPIPCGPNTEFDWCKIYGATQQIETLPNGKNAILVQAQLKNWSSVYDCYGEIRVDWNYIP